jgi:hypothetical protein
LWPYLSSTSTYRENQGVFLGVLSVLILKMYVLNFIPSYKIVQDIAETVNCLQIISQIQIHIQLFLFWHHQGFFNNSESLEARNKIKDAVLISMNRAVGKSTSFLLYVVVEFWYCSQPFLTYFFRKWHSYTKMHFDIRAIMGISQVVKQLGNKPRTFLKSTWPRHLEKVYRFYSRWPFGWVITKYFGLLGFFYYPVCVFCTTTMKRWLCHQGGSSGY